MRPTFFRTVLTVLALLLACRATPAPAADTLCTILFTGNTYGNYQPCPS